jgi:hypothetical protein
MKFSHLQLLGGVAALAGAALFFGGYAFLIGAVPLIVVFAIGFALMAYDLYLTTRENTKRET